MADHAMETGTEERQGGKSRKAFRTISEVATALDVPQHVLRFWETKFSQVKPMKRGGNRRYYRPEDMQLLSAIRHFLYTDGYTIKGVQKLLREKGAKGLVDGWQEEKDDAPAVAGSGAVEDTGGNGSLAKASSGPASGEAKLLQAVLDELKALRRSLDDLPE
jgi:DNA-binding transcriptional MerR regulator